MDTFFVVLSAAALAALLFYVAPTWRRMVEERRSLPLWGFLRRSGTSQDALENASGAAAVADAEIRCTFCASNAECRRRVASGEAIVDHCPNLEVMERAGRR